MKNKTRIALIYLVIFLFSVLSFPAFRHFVLGYPLDLPTDLLVALIVGGSIIAFVA